MQLKVTSLAIAVGIAGIGLTATAAEHSMSTPREVQAQIDMLKKSPAVRFSQVAKQIAPGVYQIDPKVTSKRIILDFKNVSGPVELICTPQSTGPFCPTVLQLDNWR